jgi:ketosteroid isomerase-like protein
VSSFAADAEQIRQTVYRYARGVDRMDRELIRSCFTPDAEIDYQGIHRGTIESFLEFLWQGHARMRRHSHQMANVLIDIDGDVATSETYGTIVLWPLPDPDADAVERTIRNRYLDRWVRTGQRWLIAARVHVLDTRSEVPLRAEPSAPLGGGSSRDRTDVSYDILRLTQG